MIPTRFTPANPADAGLDNDEVHIWRLRLTDDPGDESILEPPELARLGRLVDPRLRARRINCRIALRRLLGAYLGNEPGRIRLCTGPHGRPHLDAGVHHTDVNFNLSHAGDLAVIALARTPRLGIDIEARRPLARMQSLVARCFSASEAGFLNSQSKADRERLFFRAWTAKEAVLKAEGSGIFHHSAAIEIAWEPFARLRTDGGDHGKAAGWRLWEFCPAAGIHGTLALAAGDWRRQTLDYSYPQR